MKVAIAKCNEYDPKKVYSAIKYCVDSLGGINKFVKKNDNVALKLNLLGAYGPEKGVTTNPVVGKAVAKLVKQAGAKPFFVDSPGNGISYNEAGLKKALVEIPKLRDEFWQNVKIAGTAESMNKNLEFAGRVSDYMELAELMAVDALHRKESCGGHFREESQTEEGEALRNDENFTYVGAWECPFLS